MSEVNTRFNGKILPIDGAVAVKWGTLNASLQKKGILVGVQDLYIAAMALTNNLALVTLNTKDFDKLELVLLNPWL